MWSDERISQLETLHGEGYSFSAIASQIGVTRCAAIGKARRLKLPKRFQIPSARAERRRTRTSRRAAAMKEKISIAFEHGRDYRCTIYELTNESCRFPLWPLHATNEERLYCGIPTADLAAAQPYCARHMALVFSGRG